MPSTSRAWSRTIKKVPVVDPRSCTRQGLGCSSGGSRPHAKGSWACASSIRYTPFQIAKCLLDTNDSGTTILFCPECRPPVTLSPFVNSIQPECSWSQSEEELLALPLSTSGPSIALSASASVGVRVPRLTLIPCSRSSLPTVVRLRLFAEEGGRFLFGDREEPPLRPPAALLELAAAPGGVDGADGSCSTASSGPGERAPGMKGIMACFSRMRSRSVSLDQ
mmetsp:Transcript_4942/g.12376  ORF Transcript_4942/g.12376 Transcript_4942/m.12376 type:complete len:222 (+) Transcript_4942:2145-2810(+)